MNARTATLSHPGLSEAATPWSASPTIDIDPPTAAHEPQGRILLRLVLAAGLTVLALGVIVSVLP